MQRPYRLRIRPIQHVPAVPSYLHKLHLQKHSQVLRHRTLLNSQPYHTFPNRPFPRRQKLQYLPTPRFSHRIKRIRCGSRPCHAPTLYSHIGICQPLFSYATPFPCPPRPSLLGLSASAPVLPQRPNSCRHGPPPCTSSTRQSRRRSLLPSTPKLRVIPSGAERLFPSTSLLRSSWSAQSRNLSSPFFPSTRMRGLTPVRSATIAAHLWVAPVWVAALAATIALPCSWAFSSPAAGNPG